ncbi:translation initiation factor IF-2, partial [Candidatus Saccharibacteria bacterium]|nr:translation initiation factor IF-2 [Candidatus Saccharibacteria bacterium]
MKTTIKIGSTITVGELADRLSLPVVRIITELMKNGVLATVNEKIDFDTAQIITEELGLDVDLIRADSDSESIAEKPVRNRSSNDANAVSRPPVVAVMGHVDHGKTSLLDSIRGANVVKGEAGGITQHISAYYIQHADRAITFLDTPGHEAFAALREHGAHLTDLVIIVVAADDGIKPQTLEAIRFARKAGVKIIVAITKIDKPEANPDRIKQQLSEHELLPEEWGGDTVVLGVSSKTSQGVKELLDMVLLVADVEDLKSLSKGPAKGLIIESHMEQGKGAVARALVTEGLLKLGDLIVAGGAYGKVRSLEGTDGVALKQATPSMPVIISGLKSLPEFADTFEVVRNDKEARQKASAVASDRSSAGGHVNISG